MEEIHFFGRILRDSPNFWLENGFKVVRYDKHYNCELADGNHFPVYSKTLPSDSDGEDYWTVEVHACDYGVVKDSHMFYLHYSNSAGSVGYSLRAALQCQTIEQYNFFIKEWALDVMEDGETFLLSQR